MINIAILGFGVVGAGVAEVLVSNRDQIAAVVGDRIDVKYILDRRTFPDSVYADRVTTDFDRIVSDPDVSLVVETMGGVHPALEFSLAAMRAGKSVVTSNKEVVAKCGIELCGCAKENGVSYEFEAAVGGGIPVLRSIRTSLAADRITKIDGILNGTTNYILTAMRDDHANFADALKQAQQLGYAEADPSADINGLDTQRKVIILTALATGMLLDEKDVYAETMTKITTADIDGAAKLGASVKLVGSMRCDSGKISAFVCPRVVMNSSPLSHIDGVYNGVSVFSPITGDVMYYGRGAGRYPTAGAVVSDIAAVLSGAAKYEKSADWSKPDSGSVLPLGDVAFKYYIRTLTDSPVETFEAATVSFGGADLIDGSPEGVLEFVTDEIAENAAAEIIAGGAIGAVESVIRIL